MSNVTKQKKLESVARVTQSVKGAHVVAVASLQALPNKQFGSIRKKLRGQAEMIVARNTLLSKGLEAGNPAAAKALGSLIDGPTAVIITDQNPFKLFKAIKASKSKAPAKGGQTAPMDLIVPAGETNLAPGPVLTELKQAKVDARIQGPKVVIAKDSVVAKKGDVIPDNVAKVLTKLGIEPMEIGLNVTAVWEDGVVYTPAVLDVDAEQYVANLRACAASALNLAVFARIANKQSMPLLLTKAARQARGLAVEAPVFAKEVMPSIIGKAHRAAKAVASKAPGAV